MPRARFALLTVFGCAAIVACPSPYGGNDGPADAAPETTSTPPPSDGDVEDAMPVDAGIDATGCDLAKPFGAIVHLVDLSSPAPDYTLSMTADEKVVVLGSFRADGGPQLFVATRATLADTFSTPVLLQIADAAGPSTPSLTPDGGVLFFTMYVPGTALDLFSTTGLADGTYAAPVALDELNSAADDLTPALGVDGDEVFFDSFRNGIQGIYRSTRTAAGMFRPPVLVNEIFIDGGRQIAPVLSADGKTLYFAADTPSGLGALDIWVATRASRTDPFGPPRPVPELSSTASDQPAWLSPDGCRLYFASGRAGAGFDFYRASKPSL